MRIHIIRAHRHTLLLVPLPSHLVPLVQVQILDNSPIAIGDIVFIIQMQGAQINVPASLSQVLYMVRIPVVESSGFLTTNLMAGNMEFAVATNAVPVGGGVLNTAVPDLTYAYSKRAFGSNWSVYLPGYPGSTSFIIFSLTGTITTPHWNGSIGGVTVISAVNQLDFNGQTIDASGAGFRGGGGVS